MNLPTDICNQALDAVGIEETLGDIEEGTRAAQVCLRAYRQCLMQLLRAAHWDFARKQVPLTLLADATGNTPNVGTLVPSNFLYEYSYPTDCMKARFVPWNPLQNPGPPTGNISIPTNIPLMTGLAQQNNVGMRQRPARFLIATDFNYPPPQGQITWEVQGVSPQGRTVVLTNVKCASLVYTALMLYPSVWDAQFRAAFVSYLASEVAMPLSKDKKFGLALRADQMKIAKEKIAAARITDGNEGWYSSDIPVDWMDARRAGGGYWGGSGRGGGFGGEGGGGCYGYGWDSCMLADGTAF